MAFVRKWILFCLFGLILPLGSVLAAGNFSQDFWLLDEYLAANPKQQEVSQQFNEIVRQSGYNHPIGQEKPVRIVMVYPGLQVSDYWHRSVRSFEGRMKEIGLHFELTDHFTKPGTEIRRQNQLIAQAMKEDPDYLVFTLDALRHRGIIERILARGKTKIILQNITTPIRAFDTEQPFLYVGFDHGVGAKIMARRYQELYPNGAKYAVFYGPKGYVSRMRGGVFLTEMANHAGMELTASYYVNFDRERSYQAAMELLREQPDLNFIYACSTDIALGIVDALKETGKLGQVRVNGWGGGSAELEAIEAGELDFTVMRMNDDNGVAMAEAIRLDIGAQSGGLVPTVYSGDFELVDQQTSPAKLDRLRKYAFRYSDK